MFGTLQDRLVKELRLAGITEIEAANAFLRDRLSARPQRALCRRAGRRGLGLHPHSRRRSRRDPVRSRRSGRSATTIASPTGRSNCRSRRARCGPHFVKARVKVHVYPDGSHALFHGPRCIGRYDEKGRLKDDRRCPTRRLNPLGGAPCGRHGQASGLPTPPTGEQNQKKRTIRRATKTGQLNSLSTGISAREISECRLGRAQTCCRRCRCRERHGGGRWPTMRGFPC